MRQTPYRQLVCSLVYLSSHTHPDISFAVSILSRFVSDPNMVHRNAGKRILLYLVGTNSQGIMIGDLDSKETRLNREGGPLSAYTDSDWAGDKKRASRPEDM